MMVFRHVANGFFTYKLDGLHCAWATNSVDKFFDFFFHSIRLRSIIYTMNAQLILVCCTFGSQPSRANWIKWICNFIYFLLRIFLLFLEELQFMCAQICVLDVFMGFLLLSVSLLFIWAFVNATRFTRWAHLQSLLAMPNLHTHMHTNDEIVSDTEWYEFIPVYRRIA